MLSGLRSTSALSHNSTHSAERSVGEKALLSKTSLQASNFVKNTNNNTTNSKNMNEKSSEMKEKLLKKGRRTFAFWTLVFLLFILAVGNLVLTFTILGVLRLGIGLESMEFFPEQNIISFYGNTDLNHIYKKDGVLEGFRDKPMEISSENGSVQFTIQSRQSRSEDKLTVNRTGVYIEGVSTFEVRDPITKELVFSTSTPKFNLPNGAKNLYTKVVTTKKISSPVSENLIIKSDKSAHLKGAEGTYMESKELLWSADQDIYLKSVNGSVILSGKEGVYVDVKNIPIALPYLKPGNGEAMAQFKVCVCMPQGKLFRIAVQDGVKVSCSHVNVTADLNPCA